MNAQQQSSKGLSPEVMAWTVSTVEPWPPGKYKSVIEAMIDNKIFPPLVFHGGSFPKLECNFSRNSIRLTDKPPIIAAIRIECDLISPAFRHYLFKKSLDSMVYKSMLNNPKNFKYTIWQLPTTVVRSESIDKSKDQVKVDIKSNATPREPIDPVIKFIPDRRYWTSTFAADIKFNQNKTSDNWYKGVINTMNIYTNTNTTYNYARNKLSVANTLSTNFTIINAPNDTLRRFTIGSDELRLRSIFGLKAIRNWNYSISGDFVTAMGTKYIPNTNKKNSAFLAPYTFTAGVGMTYAVKPAFKKKDRSMDLSLSLDPLAFRYVYSRDTTINLGAYFPKDETGRFLSVQKTFGSTINMTQTTKFNKNITLFTRFNYFTSYERITTELENKLDILLNKYFSTTLHLFLRYDDGVVKKEESDTFLQINEIFAFGFSYRW